MAGVINLRCRFRWVLPVILLGALALRVGWGWRQSNDYAALNRLPDQREYVQLADSLAAGGPMSFVDPRFDKKIYAYRTPGYPVLIWAAGGRLHLVRIVQALLDFGEKRGRYFLAEDGATVTDLLTVIAGAIATSVIGSAQSVGTGMPQYLPPGTNAVALPDNSYNKSSAFLEVFGRPDSQSVGARTALGLPALLASFF